RPGVVLLQDWALGRLLALEMAHASSRSDAVREMERAYGEAGAFVARMARRGLVGELLSAHFPLNDRLLDASLGIVALGEETRRRAARRMGDDRTLRLATHLLASAPPFSAE